MFGFSHSAKSSETRMSPTTTEEIRAILGTHGRLSGDVASLEDETDLYHAGLTSHATVNLMLALEDHFDVEFPERMLRRGAFASIAAIRAAIDELVGVRT
jgi:acyl carrier protein